MSEYILYGSKLIKNDDTLKDFAKCVYENCPKDVAIKNDYELKDFILETVETILEDDISRTDINYEQLLYKFRDEFGDLFYRLWNNGIDIPKVVFLGENTKKFFNDIVYYYIHFHYDEFRNKTI